MNNRGLDLLLLAREMRQYMEVCFPEFKTAISAVIAGKIFGAFREVDIEGTVSEHES